MSEVTELIVRDADGGEVERLPVPPELARLRMNYTLLHDAVVMYLANRRQGTHSTKTRAEVKGSGHKPWMQKGTGRARSGSRASPVWRHGGVAHGPRPRDYYRRLSKKALRLALKCAIAGKIRDDEVRLVNALDFERPRTREMALVLSRLGVGGTCVVAVDEGDGNAYLSGRNIKGVSVVRVRDLNTYDVLSRRHLVMSKAAYLALLERLGVGRETTADAVGREGE